MGFDFLFFCFGKIFRDIIFVRFIFRVGIRERGFFGRVGVLVGLLGFWDSGLRGRVENR